MRILKDATVIAAMGIVTAMLLFGCGVKNDIDCHGICTRYQSCFDSSYDVGSCENRCEDNADKNSNYASTVSSCHDCMDDKSCASATFNCGSQCSNVVP